MGKELEEESQELRPGEHVYPGRVSLLVLFLEEWRRGSSLYATGCTIARAGERTAPAWEGNQGDACDVDSIRSRT